MSLLGNLRRYLGNLALRLKLAAARNLLRGPWRWEALDALGVYGHGTDLLRVDFPPATDGRPAWGHGRPPHPELAELFRDTLPAQLELLRACLAHADDYRRWPQHEDAARPELPWRDNMFLPPFDAAALYGMLRHTRPERYVEIGSGISTRVAGRARAAGAFPMEIISIDPAPRVAVEKLCNQIHRQRLEALPAKEFLQLVTPRTVVFFDGSHRSFPGSDVTIFFLNLLLRLPAGAIVHLHDIYLPEDYPPQFFPRLWSEQYLLATWLLGGARRLQVLLPCAYLASLPAPRELLVAALGTDNFGGSSFWLRMT